MTRLGLALGRPELAIAATAQAERAAELGGEVPSVRAAALRCRGLLERDPTLMAEAVELAHRSGRALGASWLTARAIGLYRSLGGRCGARGPRSRAQSGVESLTRSERAVGELVAEGLTNREIGVRLFISPHTVNSHLRHAFRKLDVSTRAGLASAVSADRARRTPA